VIQNYNGQYKQVKKNKQRSTTHYIES